MASLFSKRWRKGMVEEVLTTYVCTACNTGHSDPRKIAMCTSCGSFGTVKVRPIYMTDEPKTPRQSERCEACGGNHPTRDKDGALCANLPGGGSFSAPSDLRIPR